MSHSADTKSAGLSSSTAQHADSHPPGSRRTPHQGTVAGHASHVQPQTNPSGSGPRRPNVIDVQQGYRCQSPLNAKLQVDYICPSMQQQQQMLSFYTVAAPGGATFEVPTAWIQSPSGPSLVQTGPTGPIQGYAVSAAGATGPYVGAGGQVCSPYPMKASQFAAAQYHQQQQQMPTLQQYFQVASPDPQQQQQQQVYIVTTPMSNPPISSPHPSGIPVGAVMYTAGGTPQQHIAAGQAAQYAAQQAQQQQQQYMMVASQPQQQQQQQTPGGSQQQMIMPSPHCTEVNQHQGGGQYVLQSASGQQQQQGTTVCYATGPSGQQYLVQGLPPQQQQYVAAGSLQYATAPQIVMNPSGNPCYVQQVAAQPRYHLANVPPPMQSVMPATAGGSHYYCLPPGASPSAAYALQSATMPQQQQVPPTSQYGGGPQPQPGSVYLMQAPPPAVTGISVSATEIGQQRLPAPPTSHKNVGVTVSAQVGVYFF